MDEIRIIELLNCYKETIKDNFTNKHRSSHWDIFYKDNNKFFNIENIKNFRKKNILSEGCDDSNIPKSKLDLINALTFFDAEFLKKNLPEKNIGNSDQVINLLNYYFDYGIIHHLKWYEIIQKYIKENSIILEIGAGFGSLARIIIKNKNVKYIIIDLPESNLITNYYLQNHFPNKKIFNYLDLKKCKIEEQIKNFDIFILPPHPEIFINKKIPFDFAINTRSFMEMNKKNINDYFDLVQKNINNGGYFLNINRYEKSTTGNDLYFYKFNYDNLWDVIISEKSFLQNNFHFLLTIRKKDNGNIKNELKKIKENNKLIINKKLLIILAFKHFIKRFIYLLLRKILLLTLGKNIIKKIADMLYRL
jgi:putative sugar O-methyltransferase